VFGRALVLLATALLLAGCGGGGKPKACQSPAQVRALARIQVDLTALKHAAALPVHSTLKGNPAINRATDRFLLHVDTAPLDNLVRNRLIDHAAALVNGSCDQCFQALEAERPIPSIAHAHSGAACHAKS